MVVYHRKRTLVGRVLQETCWLGEEVPQKVPWQDFTLVPDIVTMVTEEEAVLNNRPLTYLYPDIEDNPPLTPAHFLCGHKLTTLPNLVQDKEDVDPLFIPLSVQAPWSRKQELSRRIMHYESLMTTFWTR